MQSTIQFALRKQQAVQPSSRESSLKSRIPITNPIFVMQSSRSKIRAYVIFNRHGHRAPGRNVMLGGSLQEEKELWQSCTLSDNNHENLSGTIKQHAANGIARDLITHPFGCITARGRDHLVKVGRQISECFPLIKTVNSDNLLVYSTNYQRTQVQYLTISFHRVPQRRCYPQVPTTIEMHIFPARSV